MRCKSGFGVSVSIGSISFRFGYASFPLGIEAHPEHATRVARQPSSTSRLVPNSSGPVGPFRTLRGRSSRRRSAQKHAARILSRGTRLHARTHKSENPWFFWKMPLTFPLKIHWKSHQPLEHANEEMNIHRKMPLRIQREMPLRSTMYFRGADVRCAAFLSRPSAKGRSAPSSTGPRSGSSSRAGSCGTGTTGGARDMVHAAVFCPPEISIDGLDEP